MKLKDAISVCFRDKQTILNFIILSLVFLVIIIVSPDEPKRGQDIHVMLNEFANYSLISLATGIVSLILYVASIKNFFDGDENFITPINKYTLKKGALLGLRVFAYSIIFALALTIILIVLGIIFGLMSIPFIGMLKDNTGLMFGVIAIIAFVAILVTCFISYMSAMAGIRVIDRNSIMENLNPLIYFNVLKSKFPEVLLYVGRLAILTAIFVGVFVTIMLFYGISSFVLGSVLSETTLKLIFSILISPVLVWLYWSSWFVQVNHYKDCFKVEESQIEVISE